MPQAYIPQHHETVHIEVSRWSRPPRGQFCVSYTNMLVSNKSGRPNVTTERPNQKPGKPNISLKGLT